MLAPRHRRSLRIAPPGVPAAFTLIELVVVIVILSILASLTLSGLNGARQRAKIDKTRSTIRKLHEIVIPLYESYVEKRYSPPALFSKKDVAVQQVWAKRFMLATDLPDLWDDAWDSSPTPGADWYGPDNWRTPNPRYQSVGQKLGLQIGSGGVTQAQAMAYESAECLQMIVVLGGFSPDAIEQFRSDEIGDVDKDNAPEFLDGWGRPISFIRWPAGFKSVLQADPANMVATANAPPDPIDPLGVTPKFGVATVTDRALIPLIYSGGPNNSLDIDTTATAGSYGLLSSREALKGDWQKSGWINGQANYPPLTTTRWPGTDSSLWAGAVKPGSSNGMTNSRAASDNITNHDLVTK